MNRIPRAFKAFRFLHLAMVAGLVLFGIVSVFVVRDQGADRVSEDIDRILQLAAVVFSIVILFFGFRSFKARLLKLHRDKGDPQQRVANYRAASITWWSMIEVPGLLALAGFIITGNYAFFALGLFHLMLLLMFTPRWDNIALLLSLSQEDLKKFEG
jgi:hypothetical protein